MSTIRQRAQRGGLSYRQPSLPDRTQHRLRSASLAAELNSRLNPFDVLSDEGDSSNDSNHSDQSVETREIAPDGDVILVVGPEKERLRVHSLFLSYASNVFCGMFGPNQSEGQTPPQQSSDLKEIVLEDDHAQAMYTICCVLHHCTDGLSSVNPKLLLNIAIAVDKYDLAKALTFARTEWLKSEPGMESADRLCLLLSAYLFQDRDAFSKHCLELILSHIGSYLELLPHEAAWSHIALKVLYLLEERRNYYRAELGGLSLAGSGLTCSCPWTRKLDAVFAVVCTTYTPTLTPVSVSTIVQSIEGVLGGEEHVVDCPSLSMSPSCSQKIQNRLAQLKARARICFECVEGQESGMCNCA